MASKVLCKCGCMMMPGRDMCFRCRKYATDHHENTLKDLIYNRIQDPVVAERHYKYALHMQKMVAGLPKIDKRGRNNPGKKTTNNERIGHV